MRVQDRVRVLQRGAKNAFELIRKGRLSAPYNAPFEVVVSEPTFRLRHFTPNSDVATPEGAQPLLLVPPLMVAADVYDISPELSSAAFLVQAGIDVWLVDYGAPEREEGGMERTLDDHVLAVSRSVEEVAHRTGHDVHVAGYSQGGMFVYQAAAYRRSENIASVITFGSPVDMNRALPVKVHDTLAEKFLTAARDTIKKPLDAIEGLPGALTSSGFRALSAKKEIQQIFGIFGLLHDREALERREPTRRFLTGEGFVAWPGPALRKFIDEIIVNNRLAHGGLVLGGRTVTLADITVPILYFVGTRDEIAQEDAVRSIRKYATSAPLYEKKVPAGHFGLVVGSRSLAITWPSVIEWCCWDGADATPPSFLDEAPSEPADTPPQESGDPGDRARGVPALYDLATEVVDGLWHRLGDVSLEVTSIMDAVRWQLPRLAQIREIKDDSRINVGRILAEQAAAIPDSTFFLWEGRAFSYAEANARVNQFAHALVDLGVRKGEHVGVLMDNHPDYLTAAAALNRIGAVAVLLNAGVRGESLHQALQTAGTTRVFADLGHATALVDAGTAPEDILVVGGMANIAGVPDGAISLDQRLSPDAVDPPSEVEIDAGAARDTALLMFTSGTTGLPKVARITNRRWALAGLGAAAACSLTTRDTVYCCLPLHHATGMLVGVGGALVGGARLALAPKFSPDIFWTDVRRYGATVVFYVGELCPFLLAAKPVPEERRHAIRLFVGNGLRPEVWRGMLERFGKTRVIEFYGSTEGNVCLANLSGEKIGSIGRAIEGTSTVELVKYDIINDEPHYDEDGYLIPVNPDEPGLLIAKIEETHPLSRFDGYLDDAATDAKVLRDVLEAGDAWFNTGDLLMRDADGDFWFVDRLGDTYRWKGENVSTQQVADVTQELDWVRIATAYGVTVAGHEGRAGMTAMEVQPGAEPNFASLFAAYEQNLFPAAFPRFVRLVDDLQTTHSFKPTHKRLQAQGADPERVDRVYGIDWDAKTYRPLGVSDYPAFCRELR